MKKIFILFVAILASCTSPEIEVEKPIAKVCYNIIAYHDGLTDWILVDVNGRAEKYEVSDIKEYRGVFKICDLSNLKRLPL